MSDMRCFSEAGLAKHDAEVTAALRSRIEAIAEGLEKQSADRSYAWHIAADLRKALEEEADG